MVRGKSCSSCFAGGSNEVLNWHNTIHLMHHDSVCDLCCCSIVFYPCDCYIFLYYPCLRLALPRNLKTSIFFEERVVCDLKCRCCCRCRTQLLLLLLHLIMRGLFAPNVARRPEKQTIAAIASTTFPQSFHRMFLA